MAQACSDTDPTPSPIDAQGAMAMDASFIVGDVMTADSDAPAAAGFDAVTEDAGFDAAADGPVRCMPDALRCRDLATAERCALTGDAWLSLACTHGCTNNACSPSVLSSGWSKHQFDLLNVVSPVAANFLVSEDGLSATQTRKSLPAAFLYEQEFEAVEITGRFGVQTSDDDDLIGFVFGWQDPQNFYLFDWKKATQANDCGEAQSGPSLKLAKASSPINQCADFWASTGTANVKPLATVAPSTVGWKSNTTYDFLLVFRPGNIRIEIKEAGTNVATLVSNDNSLTRGKFGFYSYLQPSVRYQDIRVQPAQR